MALQYVGGTSGTGTSTGYTVSLSGTLTGGIASSPAAGDIVVVASAFGNTASSAPAITGNNSGAYLTAGAAVHANDTWDTEFRAFYQVMGGTPDTSLTVTRVTNAAYGGATVVHVWRGVDTTTPLDATGTPASGANGAGANPPSVTPTTSGAIVIAMGAGTMPAAGTAGYTGFTGYSNAVTAYDNGSTADTSVIMASLAWTSGAADPPVATGGTQSNTSSSWAAQTIALRPAPSGQQLDPSLVTNSQTFHAPTVTPGAVGLTPSLFTNSQTFHAPTVERVFPNVNQDFGLVTDGTGDTYDFGLITDGVSASMSFGDLLEQTLTPSLFTASQTFYGPTVLRGTVTLTPALLSDGDTFFTPTVGRGTITLTPPLLSDGETFFAPTVTRGPVTLTPSLVTNTATFFAPTVGRGPVNLAPPLLTDADTFFAPTVAARNTLTPALVTDADTFFAPTVTSVRTLTAALFTDADTFFAPSVAPGAVVLSPQLLENTITFYGPTVTGDGEVPATLPPAARMLAVGTMMTRM